MKDHVSLDDHRRTLAWLDDSLEWARPRGRPGLVKLLNLVRTEVLFEMDFPGSTPPTWNRTTVDGPAFGANRGL